MDTLNILGTFLYFYIFGNIVIFHSIAKAKRVVPELWVCTLMFTFMFMSGPRRR